MSHSHGPAQRYLVHIHSLTHCLTHPPTRSPTKLAPRISPCHPLATRHCLTQSSRPPYLTHSLTHSLTYSLTTRHNMKGVYPHMTLPDWLDSPMPVFRTRNIKHATNCAMLTTHTIFKWRSGERDSVLLQHFPWLAVSLIFGALLLVVKDPLFRKHNHKKVIVGHFINILSGMRLAFLCFSLWTTERISHFLQLDTFALDVRSRHKFISRLRCTN